MKFYTQGDSFVIDRGGAFELVNIAPRDLVVLDYDSDQIGIFDKFTQYTYLDAFGNFQKENGDPIAGAGATYSEVFDELVNISSGSTSIAFVYKGTLDALNGSLPSSSKVGDLYLIDVAGDLGDIFGLNSLKEGDCIWFSDRTGDGDSTNAQNWIPFNRNIDEDKLDNTFDYIRNYKDDLNSIVSPLDGQIALVRFQQTNLLGIPIPWKSGGVYVYDLANTKWVYGAEDLQQAVQDNLNEIMSNDTDIQNLQSNLAQETTDRLSTDNSLQSQIDSNDLEIQALEDKDVLIEADLFSLDNRVQNLEDYKDSLGEIQFTDTQYTNTNRLQGLDGTPLKITNNKGGVLNLSAPSSATDWINNTGEFVPQDANGDSYQARITFTVDPNLNNRNLVCYIDIGTVASPVVIWEETKRLARGAGNDTGISLIIPFYTLGTFLANNGKLFINCDGDFEVYNIVYLLEKRIDV